MRAMRIFLFACHWILSFISDLHFWIPLASSHGEEKMAGRSQNFHFSCYNKNVSVYERANLKALLCLHEKLFMTGDLPFSRSFTCTHRYSEG